MLAEQAFRFPSLHSQKAALLLRVREKQGTLGINQEKKTHGIALFLDLPKQRR